VISFGASSPEPATFDVPGFYRRPGARLYAFMIFDELAATRTGAADLRLLADEIAAGRLDPGVSVVERWRDYEPVIESLMDRGVAGKAVLRID
jgi:hypothetical protein